MGPQKGVRRKSRNKLHRNGVSDVIACFNGNFVAIEVKSPANKKRPPHQQKFIDDINNANGLAFFSDSLDEVIERIECARMMRFYLKCREVM